MEPSIPEQDAGTGGQRELARLREICTVVVSLAHDFTNLLTAIAGHATLLKSEALPGSEVYESVSAIEKAAERASMLAGKLLSLARHTKTHRERVDLHETIGEVARLLRGTTAGSIVIRQKLEASRAWVMGDAGQLHQMILNLALNARDAMPEGGELILETACAEGPGITIAVSDTGCGIPEHIRGRIFEPFFTTKQPGKGTGMGLTIVSWAVETHGGHIQLESTVGRGSTFRVYLPACETESELEQLDAAVGSGQIEQGAAAGDGAFEAGLADGAASLDVEIRGDGRVRGAGLDAGGSGSRQPERDGAVAGGGVDVVFADGFQGEPDVAVGGLKPQGAEALGFEQAGFDGGIGSDGLQVPADSIGFDAAVGGV